MLSFIIYEKDESRRMNYVKIIRNFFYKSKDNYKIYEFSEENSAMLETVRSIEGVRIFLINVDEDSGNGLKFAKRIRHDGDFISPIILLTSKEKETLVDKIQNVLFLDIVKIDDKLVKNLNVNFKEAFKIATRHSVYTFSIFDEVYRIPYNDIYYIMKNSKGDSVTIYTKDDTYTHYVSVKSLEKTLSNDIRFFKSHRSCIVNLYNVTSYDRKDNIVIFKNGSKINLVAKNKKGEMAKRLKNFVNDSVKV